MATDDFCLKWNDHHSIFFSLAENLCQSEHLTDVTLSTGSKLFPAHKLVLSVCSSYFHNLFRNSLSGDKNAVVYLKDVDPRHIELLLGYMYRGEINVRESELMSLLNTAKGLQIKGLSDDGSSDELSNEAKKQKTSPRFQATNSLKKKRDSSADTPDIIPVKKIKEESDVTPVNVSQPSWREEIGVKPAGGGGGGGGEGGGGGTAATSGGFDPRRGDMDAMDNDYSEDIYIEGEGEYNNVPEDRQLDMYNPDPAVDQSISDSWPLGNTTSTPSEKKEDKLNSPHICEMCNQAFSQRWLLKRHWRTHTGIQPFACLVCHRRFSLRDSCLRHIKTVHKELDIPASNVNQLMVNMDVEESEEPGAISPGLHRHEPIKLSIE